ncbi:pyrimidine-nucleoside phosphorylase [Clostridium acetireducens DSM 10703]|uniref:Pyrimidine-nucleoside phosphorylase n=1 Tax=Clostridium acetireducens DSM 10703 TaxID=1121290 RepID=A0A1E8F2L1_9CLOT|nr:pyrimidine-nucleoside phosphorylase [Clostridium acetireducens]OFI07614.1 pyrimidine-nucleoside phosphorylase [Clostridium acetireducens DSM 10703]
MRMYDIILKKRNGKELSTEEINFFIDNYTKGIIPDYQASALLMAIYFKKMNNRETVDLTKAMLNSGEILDLSKIQGIKVDKHSTGGVGDTTTLVLAPMVAALGIPIVKMSGRGLGHTGGTIDKLESIKGFSVELTKEKLIENVNNIKMAVVSQTGNLAPADKKLYALRDVTATVENTSLIASSIMSKKLAAGCDAIVLDVKVGQGAFMKDLVSARELALQMVNIGNSLGKKTVAIISDMNEPLGYAIGNTLEFKEAIETLKGRGPSDLLELCLELGSNMVVLGKKAGTLEEARKMLKQTIINGSALRKLKEFITMQCGDASYVDDVTKFPKAKYVKIVKSQQEGYVFEINAENMGVIAMELGSGRSVKGGTIDLSVGIVLNKKRGDKVCKGDILAYIYANDEVKAQKAEKDILENYIIGENYKKEIPLIYEVIK